MLAVTLKLPCTPYNKYGTQKNSRTSVVLDMVLKIKWPLDGLAVPFARSQPNRAPLGCPEATDPSESSSSTKPQRPVPDSAAGVAGDPSEHSSDIGQVHATALPRLHQYQWRPHSLLTLVIQIALCSEF